MFRILPKYFRDDPFADPPPITEDDIADGMLSLLNRGIIPRDVDLSPAFERGNAPFMHNKAQMHLKDFVRLIFATDWSIDYSTIKDESYIKYVAKHNW